jgi:DnaJ-class molecular chaperone
MANDDRVIARAYRILGLEPGVSPLAARRRYRALVKESHPDRYPPDSPSQAEATRRTQEINNAYRMIKDAAVHHEVPLRQSTAASQTVSPNIASLEFDTITDRSRRNSGLNSRGVHRSGFHVRVSASMDRHSTYGRSGGCCFWRPSHRVVDTASMVDRIVRRIY